MAQTTIMSEAEAQKILAEMRDTAGKEVANLTKRIKDLRDEYAEDPHRLTEVHINRLVARRQRRLQEAAALAIAVQVFDR